MRETQQLTISPLPVCKIFKEALRFPLGQNRQFWIWVVILCLLSFVITRAGNYFVFTMLADLPIKGRISISAVLGGLGNGLVFTLLATTCHRMILLKEQQNRWTDIFRWSHRETRFFIWSFLIYIGAMFILFHSIFIGLPDLLKDGINSVKYYLMFMDYSLLDWLIPKTWIPTMWSFIFVMGVFLMKYLTLLYTASRISLIMPAIAIDEKPILFSVWNLSKGNGWRLAFLTTIPLIVYFLGGTILNLVIMPSPLSWIPAILGSVLFVFWGILEAALVSEVYKDLRSRRQVSSLASNFDLS